MIICCTKNPLSRQARGHDDDLIGMDLFDFFANRPWRSRLIFVYLLPKRNFPLPWVITHLGLAAITLVFFTVAIFH